VAEYIGFNKKHIETCEIALQVTHQIANRAPFSNTFLLSLGSIGNRMGSYLNYCGCNKEQIPRRQTSI
jgi:hypothetical protein